MSYAEENAGCLQWSEKERKGENINKTILSHYNAVRLSIFILRSGTMHVTLVGNDLTQHPLTQWHILACLLLLLFNVIFP